MVLIISSTEKEKSFPPELCFSGAVVGVDILESIASRWPTKTDNWVEGRQWPRKHSTGNKTAMIPILKELLAWRREISKQKCRVTTGLQRCFQEHVRNAPNLEVRVTWEGRENLWAKTEIHGKSAFLSVPLLSILSWEGSPHWWLWLQKKMLWT